MADLEAFPPCLKNQVLKKELENILKEICLRIFDNFSMYSSFFESGNGIGFNIKIEIKTSQTTFSVMPVSTLYQ
jgi:hypothetical protein